MLSQAAAGAFATVTGYATWQQLHQKALRGEPTALPAGYVQRLRSSVDGYTVGWEVGALPDAFRQRVCLFHGGIIEGFTTYSVIALDGDFAIGAFTNTEGSGTDADWVLRLLFWAIIGLQAGWV